MSLDFNSSADQVNCSFVSEKVSKIRFVQEKYKQADTFITGSWGSEPNAIGLWNLTKEELSNEDGESDYTPKAISKLKVDGDVTGLEFINAESIVCSTSAEHGKNAIYELNQQNLFSCANTKSLFLTDQLLFVNLNHGLTHESITIKHKIDSLHKYKTNTPAVCSALSVHETNIATVGEDGR